MHLEHEIEAQDGGFDAGEGARGSLSVLKRRLDAESKRENGPEGENLERSFEAVD